MSRESNWGSSLLSLRASTSQLGCASGASDVYCRAPFIRQPPCQSNCSPPSIAVIEQVRLFPTLPPPVPRAPRRRADVFLGPRRRRTSTGLVCTQALLLPRIPPARGPLPRPGEGSTPAIARQRAGQCGRLGRVPQPTLGRRGDGAGIANCCQRQAPSSSLARAAFTR